jgi:oxygen-dependent protoporphyrinogen oxidase
MKRVVIIGAGIGGLSAALNLEQKAVLKGIGLEIILLERKELIGGNIRSERVDGFLVEGGPDCFLSEKPWAMELSKKLGLGDKLLPTNEANKKTFVLSGGRLHDLPEGVILMVPTKVMPFLKSSLISWPGKIRMGLEYFVPKLKSGNDESLGDFVTRRLGKEALDKIAEPLIAGIHGGDPKTMSVRASFPKFVQMEEQYGSLIKGMLAKMRQMQSARKSAASSKDAGAPKPKTTMFMTLKDGLFEIVEKLVERLEMTTIKTGVSVSRVEVKDGGYRVIVEGGEVIQCDSVIVATPAYAASGLLSEMDKELSTLLNTIPYVSTATVSLGFKKKDIKMDLNGFGFVIPKAEGKRIMAASWVSVKFPYRAPDDSVLIRCFVGGAKNEEMVFLSDEKIAQVVAEDLSDIMGIEAEPTFKRIFRWHKAMPQYTIGHEERVAKLEERVDKHPGLYLSGSAYHGVGISDCIRMGEETSVKVLDHLEK